MSNTYYSIDSADGTNICSGLRDEHLARLRAERCADEAGEPMRLYSNDPDDEGEVIEPAT